MSPAPGTRLGSYEIVAQIGAGGMGEVYRARDAKLGRDVAIKVLPEEVASDRERLSRFEQEARAASALNHPNIITIHDIAEEGSTRYIVMEYVEGKTLREALGPHPVPTNKLLQLGTQIAEGLAKAHAAGIVHRDLMPENLMVTEDGFVKILDFGLAKLVPEAGAADSAIATMTEGRTTPGAVVGTVGYMSPEQATGLQADYRSDQFSLGAILYEMATGQRAFQRDSPVQTLSAIIEREPVPLAELSPSLSPHLRAIVARCLAKDPQERYDSTRDLARDLKSVQDVSSEAASAPARQTTTEQEIVSVEGKDKVRVTRDGSRLRLQVEEASGERIDLSLPVRAILPIVGIVVAVLLTLVVLLTLGGPRERFLSESGRGRIESVVVLPLENLSGDPQQEFFADGMTEALIADLAKIRSLKVISRTSAMRYKGSDKTIPEIADELDVDAVIEGSALRVGDRVRITAQLIHAETDQHLWVETYERDLRDILGLQSEVARAIAREIEVELTGAEEERLARVRPVNPKAHEAYLKGRFYWNRRTPESLQKGLQYFEEAIEEDPASALAYSGVADSYNMLASYQALSPKEGFPQAKAAAQKALAIDPTLAEAHTSLALAMDVFDWDWTGAEAEFKRAIELNPGYATAHQWYAGLLEATGRHDEAIAEARKARDLDPLSLIINRGLGRRLYFARRYAESIEQELRTLELDPDFSPALVTLGKAYAQKSMFDEAISALQRAKALSEASGGGGLDASSLGSVLAMAGRKDEAESVLRELMELSQTRYVASVDIAVIYAGLGDADRAFDWLEKAHADRSVGMDYLGVESLWDPLRSDPRFQDLLRRMNLPAVR